MATDPDIDAYVAETRAARRASAARAAKRIAVFLVALVVGAAAGLAVGRWDSARKQERLARFERGDLVVTRRGENIHDTSPSLVLVAVSGGGTLAVVFAAGIALALKDRTYLRGVGRALGRSE